MNPSRLRLKHGLLGIALSAALLGCSDKDEGAAAKGPAAPVTAAEVAAGKAVAERECKTCHGLDGKGVAPAIPNLAGQRSPYLLNSLAEYKQRKRQHAALREIATGMSDAEIRNVAAYYASLPPIPPSATVKAFSAYEHGKAVSAACAKCHNADGNSTTPGVPGLAGQQPRYLATATQEYLNGTRGTIPMHNVIRDLSRLDLDSVILYFASQQPAQRGPAPFGDRAAGERATLLCAGCHGLHGVSADSATPTVAGQDPKYLVESIKAYRNQRRHEPMQHAVAALSDQDIDNIAAFYSPQPSKPAENGRQIVEELTQRCNRCHDAAPSNSAFVTPILRGQDKEYLVMALRAYRDDRRESSTMHRMSLPYGDAIIESIASWYASQPADRRADARTK